MNNVLYFFTQAVSAALTLARVTVRSILPNLYLVNKSDDRSDTLIYAGDYPVLYPQAYGEYLDRLGFMFNVARFTNELDDDYRERILFSISQNSTTTGLELVLQNLLKNRGYNVSIKIIENNDNFFDAETTTLDTPLRSEKNSMLYQVSIFIKPERNNIDNYVPIYYNYFEEIFGVDTFQLALNDIVSAGIQVESVTFLSPGAGGAKGEFYAY